MVKVVTPTYLRLNILETVRYTGLMYGPPEGTVAAAPPPFRLGDPALCGSLPLVTPKY